ncbi:unnamed protein product [Meganyctiphanes norvegica]|uniref:Uncharacterized protein n=1 Tax=Meganyctiphanes norvegica TaxID=48144 RepID=A0AAV2RC24_MEGNR
MKTIIFSCVLAMAMAAPQFNTSPLIREPIAILSQEFQLDGPNFRYGYESQDGTAVTAFGSPGADGASNIEGSYSFVVPSGELVEVRYIANENGAQYSSPILPQQVQPIHPVPEHALELIRIAEELRSQGVQWDNQGFRI